MKLFIVKFYWFINIYGIYYLLFFIKLDVNIMIVIFITLILLKYK